MKKLIIATGMCLVLAGCSTASFNATTFNTESLIADSAADATHVFNMTYPSNSTPQIASTREQLYAVDKNLSLSLKLVDSMRTNYVATGSTNLSLASAIQATMLTAQSQYSTITNLVNSVK